MEFVNKAEEGKNASKMKEQVQQTFLAEVHKNLMKSRDPRKPLQEHAMFYERISGGIAIEVGIWATPIPSVI